jgi:putative ABC transport system substrate-binding protein
MRRRDFVAGLAGSVAWPISADAQQPAMPVVGFLNAASPDTFTHLVAAFRKGLSEGGYFEGHNVAIEYRWAEGQYDRLPAMAADLVRRHVTVMTVTGGRPSVLAAKAATHDVPIVFVSGDEVISVGLVASLNRPGGNATGVMLFNSVLGTKRLALLRELIPRAATIAVLVNPNWQDYERQLEDVQAAVRTAGLQLLDLRAATERQIDAAFATLLSHPADVLFVATDTFFNNRRDQLVTLAARHRIPTIYEWREFTAAGGLISYGTSLTDAYRQAGLYTGRVLKGEKPADLPVVQPTKFELVINLKTVKSLGLEVPDKLLALADEVIE